MPVQYNPRVEGSQKRSCKVKRWVEVWAERRDNADEPGGAVGRSIGADRKVSREEVSVV
jgi:hypothetical protein